MNLTTPPHNIESEEATIGAALIDPGVIDELSIQPSEFYIVKNGWVWSAIKTLHDAGTEIDLLTVQEELDSRGQLAEIGGPAYLTRMITLTPSSYNAQAYARLVSEAATRRALLVSASEIARQAYDIGTDIDSVLSASEAALHAATEQRAITDTTDAASLASAHYDAVQARLEGNTEGRIATGFCDLDSRLGGGLKPSYALMVAGEPGKGKTILATQAAINIAERGTPVAFFSMEMTADQLQNRIASWKTGIPERSLETGNMTPDQWKDFTAHIEWMSRLPIYISDSVRWNTSTLRAALVKLKRLHGVEVFVLDYFRLLSDRYGTSEHEREEYISKRLKFNICKTLGLAAVIVHTLNKAGMGASIPHMENMSGSGQIAYDMDAVMFINDHIPQNGESYNPRMRTLTIDKNRFGNDYNPVSLIALPDRPALGNVARL